MAAAAPQAASHIFQRRGRCEIRRTGNVRTQASNPCASVNVLAAAKSAQITNFQDVEIRARIDRGGRLGPIVPVPLEHVYTAKHEISRWDRSRDFEKLVQLFADEATRDTIPAVELLEIPDWVTEYLTRVADVVVKP